MARFLIAQSLADKKPEPVRSKAMFSKMRVAVASVADVVDTADEAEEEQDTGKTLILEGNPADIEAKRKELPADYILETEKLRRPGTFHPLVAAPHSAEELTSGLGATIEINVSSAGAPVPEAQITMTSVALRGGFPNTTFGVTDENGRALLTYNPNVWIPLGVAVLPRSRAWPVFTQIARKKLNILLPPLPRGGPLGWWHRVLGLNSYSEQLGEGIRVGVIDTGVGPHPYLSHVRSAGAFLNGKRLQSPESLNDVAEHGTHVAGIIGARPASGSKDFAGIAPGAELVAARVYPGGGPPNMESGPTSNGDIAQAILTLARDEECDIINLSSGGPMRSRIEADRITAALNRGTLVICSVGNGSGFPVMYPAAEPAAIGVSALGPTGGVPFGILDMFSYPTQPDRFSFAGFFAPNFISVGMETKLTGPGVGIVSTAPARVADEAPYVSMSGTSMSAPAVAGALAAILSQDPTYKSLPRNRERSSYAWRVLLRSVRTLGLNQQYQGYGMPVVQTS